MTNAGETSPDPKMAPEKPRETALRSEEIICQSAVDCDQVLTHGRRPRMEDVARVAGVSHQTVSRVLNNVDAVHPDTRQRVLAAIAKLGYRRNVAARALATSSSKTFGVVTFGPDLYGPASTLMGVENAAREAGYYVSVANMRTVDARSVRATIEHFMEQGVDGLVFVITSMAGDETFDSLQIDIPMVVIGAGRPPRAGEIPIAVDQELGARLAVRHLIDQGHLDIMHLTGPPDSFDSRARVLGYCAAMEEAGLQPRPVIEGDWTAERGYQIGKKLATGSLPSAIFASNDAMALGLIYALTEEGHEIPTDVSIIGFDDIPGSEFYRPPLTTVAQNFEALGRNCIEVLLAAIEKTDKKRPAPIKPELIVRGSTARPRS